MKKNNAENTEKSVKEKRPSEFKKMFRTKAFRAGGYSSLAAAIVIIIAILINLLVSNVSTAYTQLDTTTSGLYSISEQTKSTISSLENEVNLYYIVSKDSRVTYVTKLLDKLSACGKKLNVEYVDPDVDPDFASKYTDETVANGDVLVVCGDKSRVVTSSEMIKYEAGSYEYYQYYLQQGQETAIYWNGEVELISAIDYVITDKTYKVYCVDGHGDGDFSALTDNLENENITCDTLTLKDGDSIPEDASCVILTNLSEDIDDFEYTILSKYMSNGGKLYLAVNYSTDGYDNVEKLMSDFGLSFTDGKVNEGDKSHYNSYSGTTEDLLPDYTGDHAIIYPLTEASNYIYFPGAMGIESKEKDNVTVTPLLSTSSSAYLTAEDGKDPDFKTFSMGVVVDNTKTGAQLVVYGTSDYMTSDNTSLAPANIDLFVNSIGYLCDKDSAISVHAKSISSSETLDFSKTSTGLLTVVITVLPALIAVVAGIVIWYRRKNY